MLILHLLLAVTGGGMAVVLAVVMLIYAVHLPENPHLSRDLPELAYSTLIFTAMGGLAAIASTARIRRWPRRLWWEVALWLSTPLGVMLLIRIFQQ